MRNVPGLVAASAQKAKMIALASAVLSGLAFTPVIAAEREQVRAAINLIAATKMPFPERFDGLADVGSTTRMELPAHAPVATVIQFFVRGTGRGDYQKLYDDGVQVAPQIPR